MPLRESCCNYCVPPPPHAAENATNQTVKKRFPNLLPCIHQAKCPVFFYDIFHHCH